MVTSFFLLEYSHAHSSRIGFRAAGLGHRTCEVWDPRAENMYHLALARKSLPTLDFASFKKKINLCFYLNRLT